MLLTLELGGKRPVFLESSFVEDATLLLTARVKRDGYLKPSLTLRLTLAGGGQMQMKAEKLLENPLPHSLQITEARFEIHKGVLYYYQSLQFEGIQSLREKQARAFFVETETLFHLKRARIYTPEQLRRSLSSLEDVLDQHGYHDVKAEATAIERDDRTGAVNVRIRVQQGPKYLVRSVKEEFFFSDTNQPLQTTVIAPGKPYSRLWLQDLVLSLKTNLYRLGYPDTSVEIKTVQQTPQDNGVQMDLLATVRSGPLVHIGGLEFRGQKRTSRGLMARRVRVQRGDLLNPIEVEAGRYRLAQFGIFDSVALDYRALQPDSREVLYEVKEGKTIDVSLLIGWGSYEMLRGGIEANLNNLWGLAHHVNVQAIQSFKSSSGQFTYTIPEWVGRDYDLFFDASALRREEVDFTRIEYGGGAGLHKYFQPAATDVVLRYNYRILNALDFSSVEGVASEGLTNPAVGSITFEAKHDRRDNPLYPRNGYKVFLTLETATEYLGGDANFQRVELSTSWHHPLGGGRYLSLGLSQGADITFGSPANNLPFNSRFFPGGENSIRGYKEGEASPRNPQGQLVGAETYTLGTVEVEQALTAKWSLVVFSDSLGFARRIQQYPWDTGLFSVGGGLRWRTIIGPVRLEYGYNLNPRPGDPTGTLLFSLGYPF
jgi:outer membrane protein assembly complex protein YaeT